MTRHARNCTAGAVYTYHEKQKDAKSSGYGTNRQRLAKESVKDFDCCSLSLQPCRIPMITKDGVLFDKEVIFKYVLEKKEECKRRRKEYEKLKRKVELELNETRELEQIRKIESFQRTASKVVATTATTATNTPSISNMSEANRSKLPSFWLPSESPIGNAGATIKSNDAKLAQLPPPPTSHVHCPITNKILKITDLIAVHFTPLDPKQTPDRLVAAQNRYVCAVTNDILSNTTPCAVLKTTGHVVTMDCVERIIKKDWLHPLTGDKLTPSDIIPMQMGGTGYASTNRNLEGKHQQPVLQA